MRTINGTPDQIQSTIIARVAYKTMWHHVKSETVVVTTDIQSHYRGYAAVVTTAAGDDKQVEVPTVYGVSSTAIEVLHEGDIVAIDPTGCVQQIWEVNSRHNFVMVCGTCNCRCIMCPQPLTHESGYDISLNMRMLKLIREKEVCSIGFTGGEPTLKLDDLCTLLTLCKERFPKAPVAVLTNGRVLHDYAVVQRLADIGHPAITYCVALQADVATIHDELMGVKGCFRETVRGLQNLALLKQRVELRVVLQQGNFQRLPSLAEFIYRNFPFVVHIAFMGLETTGLAWENIGRVWIDPTEYTNELSSAIHHLHQRDLAVSIYNLPLCLLPRSLWQFARDSISSWKKVYLPQCEHCQARVQCSGVFSTSKQQSDAIQPRTREKNLLVKYMNE